MLEKLKTLATQLPLYAKLFIPVMALFLIGFFMPRATRFKYEFVEGQVWRNGDLVAPFDFTLYKTDTDLLSEKQKVLQEFSPYYTWHTNAGSNAKTAFAKAFQSQIKEQDQAYQEVYTHTNQYKKVGDGLLDIIYRIGLIGQDSLLSTKANSFVINIINGNQTFKRTKGNLYTLHSAYDFLIDSLPHSVLRNPEFLLPVLEQVLIPNLTYNDSLTQKYKNRAIQSITPNIGSIKRGDFIVGHNERIGKEEFQKLTSLKRHYESDQGGKYANWLIIIGNFALVGVILAVFFQFIRNYNKQEYSRFGDLFLLFMWPVLFAWLAVFVAKQSGMNPYFIPFAIVPLVARSFFPIRLSLILHTVIVIISSFILGQGFDFVIVQIIVGIVALIVGKETRYWGQFFGSIGLIILTYALMVFLLGFVKSGDVHLSEFTWLPWLVLNGLLLLIAYPLIPLLGKIFGKITPIQLAELADFNHPLLKELSLIAPGTFQHSLQVSNLAEAAANAIGANALLVKVGALFHDIGKMKNPQYFIENQKGGTNPHNKLSARESVAIILGHVTEGERLAKKHKLPKEIINLILTHHGTSRVEYFYRTEVNEKGEDAVNPKDFTYPGTRPKTKEEVILMIADSLEAASHSLKNPNEESLNNLIEKVIEIKQETNQFGASNMTFVEFETVIKTIKKTLHSIYHIRVEYPD